MVSTTWGMLVLLFIIGSHPAESQVVLNGLGVGLGAEPIQLLSLGMPLFVLSMLWMVFTCKSLPMIVTVSTLMLTTQLSLPIAFGIYFLGQHSIEAWSHLAALNPKVQSQKEMWIEALPFTLGALILLGLTIINPLGIQFNVGWLVIVGSCITLPHIVHMNSFYQRKVSSRSRVVESSEDVSMFTDVKAS